MGEVDGMRPDYFTAHADALAAQDAFFHVTNEERIAIIQLPLAAFALRGDSPYPVGVSVILKATIAALLAGQAVGGMIGKIKLQQGFAPCIDPFRVGEHLHALGHGGGAGRKEFASPTYLDHTQPTGSYPAKLLMEAKSGDLDASFSGHI
jgi:hypothetical protein